MIKYCRDKWDAHKEDLRERIQNRTDLHEVEWIDLVKDDCAKSIHDKSIYVLGISTRTRNLLKRHNCRTISDVVRVIYEIPEWRGVGEVVFNEIRDAIIEVGAMDEFDFLE